MAFKFEIIEDDYLRVIDTLTADEVFFEPKSSVFYNQADLKTGSINLFNVNGVTSFNSNVFFTKIGDATDVTDTLFTIESFKTFCITNKLGFKSALGGSGATAKIYKYTANTYADLATITDQEEGDIARVYNSQGVWILGTQKSEGAYTYLSGVWEYGSRSLQAEVVSNDADILALQNEQVTQNDDILLNTAKVGITVQQATDITDNNTDRHTHTNKTVIDKFGEDVGGLPTYNGNVVDTTIAQRDVYDGLDSIDNTISLSANQGKVLKDAQDLNTGKLSTIENNATADQSDAEIKTAYENNANTNEFTDAEKTKLGNQSGTNTGDQDISGIGTNATAITTKVTKITSVDNNVPRFNGATGDIQGSSVNVLDNGNVGIGATNPIRKLDVRTNEATITIDKFPIVAVHDSDYGNFSGIGLAVRATGAVKAGIALERKVNWGLGTLHFLNNNISNDNDATLADSMMAITKEGNVGIGTAAPTANLHIQSLTDAVLYLEADTGNGDENNNPTIRLSQDAGAIITEIGNNGNSESNFTGSLVNGAYINTLGASTSPIQFATNSIARMTIETGGDVGIGTNNPSVLLHLFETVSPQLFLEGDTDTSTAVIRLQADTTNNSTQYGMIVGGALHPRIPNSYGIYDYDSTAYRLVLVKTGNVGIGTDTPGAKLEIGGAGEGIILASPDGTKYIITVANGGALTTTAV